MGAMTVKKMPKHKSLLGPITFRVDLGPVNYDFKLGLVSASKSSLSLDVT